MHSTLCAFGQNYHFRDLTKMVVSIDSQRFAGFYGTTYSANEILPPRISKHLLEFTGVPYFYSIVFIVLD